MHESTVVLNLIKSCPKSIRIEEERSDESSLMSRQRRKTQEKAVVTAQSTWTLLVPTRVIQHQCSFSNK